MRENHTHLIIIFLLTAIGLNLLVLDLKIFSPASIITLSDVATMSTPPPEERSDKQISTSSGSFSQLSCPQSCQSLIQQATASTNLFIGSAQYQTAIGQSASREIYIPLGSGSTQKNSWDDLIATETIIDPANYGKIKEAYFIASLRNPTQNGQVDVQLYNVTDNYPVFGTHLVLNGPASQTITSEKFAMPEGNKLYRVQLKSSLSAPSYLDNAKIRLITQ